MGKMSEKVILPKEFEEILNTITEDQVRKTIKDAIDGRKLIVSIMRS